MDNEIASINIQPKHYQSTEELGVQLREANYDSQLIRGHLTTHLQDTIDALFKELDKSKIGLADEPGKSCWLTVLNYCKERKMEESVEFIEHDLYTATAPLWRQIILDFYADLSGCLPKAATFGIVLANPIIREIRKDYESSYISRILGFNF